MSTVPASNPGVKVLVKDGYTLPANSAPYAERMVLIAKAGTSPAANIAELYYTPIPYTSIDAVIAAYGADSDAAAAFIQAHGAGGANIFVCATPKAAASVPTTPVDLTTVYSPDEYEVFEALKHCDIAQPDMIVLMGYEINKKYTLGAAEARVSKIGKMLVDTCNSYGEDGFPCFAIAHPAMPKLTAPDTDDLDPITSAVALDSYLTQTFVTAPTGYVIIDDVIRTLGSDSDEESGISEDLSKYLVLVFGEIEMMDQWKRSVTEGELTVKKPNYRPAVAAVAGSVYVNGLEQAVTMRKISRVQNIRYNFSKSQRKLVLSYRCLPVALDNRGYAVTVDGVTLAQPFENEESMYARLSTLRLAFEVIKSSRRIVEPVIGQPAANHVMDSIQTLLGAYYGTLKNKGLAYDIGFNFDYFASEYKLIINISLIPMGEIRTVELRVGVSMR